jgi:hypothetical protein
MNLSVLERPLSLLGPSIVLEKSKSSANLSIMQEATKKFHRKMKTDGFTEQLDLIAET